MTWQLCHLRSFYAVSVACLWVSSVKDLASFQSSENGQKIDKFEDQVFT